MDLVVKTYPAGRMSKHICNMEASGWRILCLQIRGVDTGILGVQTRGGLRTGFCFCTPAVVCRAT